MNRLILKGRIGKDPELRYTTNGTAVCSCSLATEDGYGDNKKTNWHNLIIWGKSGEAFSKYTKKGDERVIEGSVDYRSWDDNNGDKKYITEVKVDNWHFCGSRSNNENTRSGNENSHQVTEPPFNPDDDLPF